MYLMASGNSNLIAAKMILAKFYRIWKTEVIEWIA